MSKVREMVASHLRQLETAAEDARRAADAAEADVEDARLMLAALGGGPLEPEAQRVLDYGTAQGDREANGSGHTGLTERVEAYVNGAPGNVTSAEVAAAVGVPVGKISSHLSRSTTRGRIHRVSHGVYCALRYKSGPGWAMADVEDARRIVLLVARRLGVMRTSDARAAIVGAGMQFDAGGVIRSLVEKGLLVKVGRNAYSLPNGDQS